MKSSNAYIAFAVILSLGLSGYQRADAAEAYDDEGTLIRLTAPAMRIISLAPSLTEILYAAGAGSKVVGVVEFSDYPPEARSLPVVGRHDALDLETLLALQPDLVIAWRSGSPRAAINRLRELGLTVYVAEPQDLDTVASHLDRLGTLAGTGTVASAASAGFRRQLQDLRTRYARSEPVRTFYQVWDRPLITAGGKELINDIISLCGGTNIFRELSRVAPKVSVESVLSRDPQIIVASGMDQERPEWLDSWRDWTDLSAVRNDKLFFIPPDLMQRHTPRALEGAQRLCVQIESVRESN